MEDTNKKEEIKKENDTTDEPIVVKETQKEKQEKQEKQTVQGKEVKQEKKTTSNGKIAAIVISVVLGVSLIIIVPIILIVVIAFKAVDNYMVENDYDYVYTDEYEDYEEEEIELDFNSEFNDQSTNEIKGKFTRNLLSGKTFDYNTLNTSAIIELDDNSEFTFKYEDGRAYKGTYELYNGFHITVKATQIKEDPEVNSGEMLAEDINNVTTAMMTDLESVLNIYLLWLKTDDGLYYPFMIKYDADTNEGVAVDVYGAEQGAFTAKTSDDMEGLFYD